MDDLLYITDVQILKLVEILVEMREIENWSDFCRINNINRRVLSPIKKGKQHFTTEHLIAIIHNHNINPAWLFNIPKSTMHNQLKPTKTTTNKKANK